MNVPSSEESTFSSLCIEQCGGRCCAPWWGIVSYTLRKPKGLSGMKNFRADLLGSIRSREKRIRDNYITSETPPQSLFGKPERYNVAIENISIEGDAISLTLRAMFAFRCLFLSPGNRCTIHPAEMGGKEIRPPHCGYMGSIGAKEGEKGFCRIIHAAEAAPGDTANLEAAIELEARSSDKFFKGGVPSADEATDKVLEEMKKYCREKAPHLLEKTRSDSKPGRNDPCYCGSGKKYKKCHG